MLSRSSEIANGLSIWICKHRVSAETKVRPRGRVNVMSGDPRRAMVKQKHRRLDQGLGFTYLCREGWDQYWEV